MSFIEQRICTENDQLYIKYHKDCNLEISSNNAKDDLEGNNAGKRDSVGGKCNELFFLSVIFLAIHFDTSF